MYMQLQLYCHSKKVCTLVLAHWVRDRNDRLMPLHFLQPVTTTGIYTYLHVDLYNMLQYYFPETLFLSYSAAAQSREVQVYTNPQASYIHTCIYIRMNVNVYIEAIVVPSHTPNSLTARQCSKSTYPAPMMIDLLCMSTTLAGQQNGCGW